jgi:hypothetical protein
MNEVINGREISRKELVKLLEKAKESPVESSYVLILNTNNRPGEAFMDTAEFEIIYGEVETIELERYFNYPYENGARYLLIPKTVPAVVRWWHRWDFGRDAGEREEVYVFTAEGWKCVRVR